MQNARWIIGVVLLVVILYFFGRILFTEGRKDIYCLDEHKCITVWKRNSSEVFIILGSYKKNGVPSDNYVKLLNPNSEYFSAIFLEDGQCIIDIGENNETISKSSSGILKLFNEEKILNDSLYTYFDGKYTRYLPQLDILSIDIKENYADDKNGDKID